MWYACGKQYSACVTCMRWCSNTEKVPLLVSIIHDIILVRTQYVLVCTGLYYYTFPVPSTYYFPRVRTRYILVCTVFTKIMQWMLFYVVCLWETILCMRDMYAVVLQYWISAPIGVQHTRHYFGTYLLLLSTYKYVLVCTISHFLYQSVLSTYRYVPVPN